MYKHTISISWQENEMNFTLEIQNNKHFHRTNQIELHSNFYSFCNCGTKLKILHSIWHAAPHFWCVLILFVPFFFLLTIANTHHIQSNYNFSASCTVNTHIHTNYYNVCDVILTLLFPFYYVFFLLFCVCFTIPIYFSISVNQTKKKKTLKKSYCLTVLIKFQILRLYIINKYNVYTQLFSKYS